MHLVLKDWYGCDLLVVVLSRSQPELMVILERDERCIAESKYR